MNRAMLHMRSFNMDEMQFLLADSKKDLANLTDSQEDNECFERLVERYEQDMEWQS
jgi:hypothetical protein